MNLSCRLTRWAAASGLVLALLIVPALPVAQTTVSIVMSGLDSPRGLAFGPDGALYVTEAGRGAVGADNKQIENPATDPRCYPGPQGGVLCYGPTGAISRLWSGVQTRVATGLPSTALPDGTRGTGPTDIVLAQGPSVAERSLRAPIDGAYVTIGFENDPMVRSSVPLIPQLARFATFVHVAASGEWRLVADIGAYEAANNPDGRLTDAGLPHLDTNPYGLVKFPGGHLMTDAGANALLRVRASGHTSLVAVFQSRGSTPPRPSFAPFPRVQPLPPAPPLPEYPVIADAVPTSVVLGPDGAYYVSELTGVPFVDTRANIYRVVPADEPQMFFIQDACLTGFKMILDMAFDDDGNLYVLQHSTGELQGTAPGVLIRVTPDKEQSSICAQYQSGTRTRVLGGLSRPTSVAIGPEGAVYVTNNGTAMAKKAADGTWLTGGQVLRIESPAK
jgi:hypothetical protein